MSLNIVDRPATTVVGLLIVTKPLSPDIPALWPTFVARLAEIRAAAEPDVSYGVMKNDPARRDVLDYMAAISVSRVEAIPPGMVSFVLPAGRYAAFRYPLSELGRGFDEIFSHRLPGSAYEQIDGPYFERYDEAFDPANPRSEVEIYIPVRRRATVPA
jgi:AraC family transcriptional regulator